MREAGALLFEAEKGRREVLGNRHRETLGSIDAVARLLQRQASGTLQLAHGGTSSTTLTSI